MQTVEKRKLNVNFQIIKKHVSIYLYISIYLTTYKVIISQQTLRFVIVFVIAVVVFVYVFCIIFQFQYENVNGNLVVPVTSNFEENEQTVQYAIQQKSESYGSLMTYFSKQNDEREEKYMGGTVLFLLF